MPYTALYQHSQEGLLCQFLGLQYARFGVPTAWNVAHSPPSLAASSASEDEDEDEDKDEDFVSPFRSSSIDRATKQAQCRST